MYNKNTIHCKIILINIDMYEKNNRIIINIYIYLILHVKLCKYQIYIIIINIIVCQNMTANNNYY